MVVLSITKSYDKQKIDIITNYGDKFSLSVAKSDTLRDKFIKYEIYSYGLDDSITFKIKSSEIPENLQENFIEIIALKDIHVYKIQNYFVYIYKNKLHFFESNYTLDEHLVICELYDKQNVESIIRLLESLVESKIFDYVKSYSDILMYENKSNIYLLAQNWSVGNISTDEINANPEYVKEDLTSWANDFVKRYATKDDDFPTS